jgi:hypothetical protein
MNAVKTTITNRDKYLGAILRVLANQVAGFKVVGGLSDADLRLTGFYIFQFSSGAKVTEFCNLIDEYITDFHRSKFLKIERL